MTSSPAAIPRTWSLAKYRNYENNGSSGSRFDHYIRFYEHNGSKCIKFRPWHTNLSGLIIIMRSGACDQCLNNREAKGLSILSLCIVAPNISRASFNLLTPWGRATHICMVHVFWSIRLRPRHYNRLWPIVRGQPCLCKNQLAKMKLN